MKRKAWLFALSIIFLACKKDNDKNGGSNPPPPPLDTPVDINAKLQGKWLLISETRSGNYDNSRYQGLPSDYIEYKSDGKAYSTIQGQYGLIYSHNLNASAKTLNFHYVTTHPHFMVAHPCATIPGCPRPGEIKFISDKLLVISGTFNDTFTGVPATLTIVDSLTRYC